MNNRSSDISTYGIKKTTAITLSDDGLVRLTLDVLLAIPLVHLISGVDEEPSRNDSEGATSAAISGYTEWISVTSPILTIGWDWRLGALQSLPRLTRQSSPRSNAMLVDAGGRDLGLAKTVAGLEVLIDSMEWQEVARSHITMRYV